MPKTRRPARWELHTIPADIVHRLPYELEEFVLETLRYRAMMAKQTTKAGRAEAAKYLTAINVLNPLEGRFGPPLILTRRSSSEELP